MLEKKSLKCGKGKKMYSKTRDGRQQGQETNEKIGTPSPPLGGSQSFTSLTTFID